MATGSIACRSADLSARRVEPRVGRANDVVPAHVRQEAEAKGADVDVDEKHEREFLKAWYATIWAMRPNTAPKD
jgi:hypothetical protein